MQKHTGIGLVATAVLLTCTAASAQPSKDRDWTGQFAGGYAYPQSDAGDALDADWAFQGGATYRPVDWRVALSFELGWHQFDLESQFLPPLVDGGHTETWNVTANLAWPFVDKDTWELYAIGGVGYYDVEGKLTEEVLYSGWYCDPWYWYCYPGISTGDAIVADKSWEEFGYNAGVGLGFDLSGGNQLYIETRYHAVDISGKDYDFMPFTIGFRF